MPSVPSLGIFWGNNSFSLVESHQDTPNKILRVLHHPSSVVDPMASFSNSDDMQFVSPLKEALKANGINSANVNLALPSKDIIIRSFVVPQVKASELNGIVEFEVKRYIPFNLKDLSYTFQISKIVDGKNKFMRIYFVAIRKEILDRYQAILKQVGLNVVYSEPAPMSLVRLLLYRKLIRSDLKVAVVLTDVTDPGIIIVDKGVVHFVRDFQLQNPTLNIAPLELDMLRKKLFNEIKISIDFYIRQFKSEGIDQVYTLSFSGGDDLNDLLQRELERNIVAIKLPVFSKLSTTPDAGIVSAQGVNLYSVAKTVDFNLSVTASLSRTKVKFQDQIPEELIPVIKIGVICLVALTAISFLTKKNVANMKKKYEAQVESQGAFVDMSLEDIDAKIKDQRNKLKKYQDVYNKSEISFLITYLAKNLPAGIWLNDFTIAYDRTKKDVSTEPPANESAKEEKVLNPIMAEVSGFSYSDDPNEQFKMVYSLVNLLKSDKTLRKYSRAVTLAGIQSEEGEDFQMTSFKIQIK